MDRSGGGRRWLITLVATVVSTYALDVIATTCGIALVASGVLDGLEGGVLVGILAASYVVWALGLRQAMAANRLLLAHTGLSTNALSKLAWGLARRASTAGWTHRLAADAGYLVWELVKELPYYLATAGAVVAVEGIGTDEALVFLTGANLGAAIYELLLARGTRVVAMRRPVGPPEGVVVRPR
jgi:hypothetical protein